MSVAKNWLLRACLGQRSRDAQLLKCEPISIDVNCDDDLADDVDHDHDHGDDDQNNGNNGGGDDDDGEGQRQRYAGTQVRANLNKSCALFVATFVSPELLLLDSC